MKKQLATFALAIVMGVLGFAVSGVAVAGNGKPPSPPGQDECEHGNAAKPCKEDPQPDNGKDCEEHGNHGGVNEDHCKGEETPPSDTTPSDTTPSDTTPNDTTPNDTTPNDTTPNDTTPSDTTPGQTTPSETTTQPAVPSDGSNPSAPPSTASGEPSSTQQPDGSSTQTTDPSPEQASESSSSQSSQATPKVLGKPPAAAAKKKPATALGVTATAAKPTRKAQQAPLTL
jgi:hypothetical protein